MKVGHHHDSLRSLIKVDTERIDQVVDAVGELVVIKSQLINEVSLLDGQSSKFATVVSLLDLSIRDLLDKALSMRLQPLRGTFVKLQRVAKDLSVRSKKLADVTFEGEDTEIDRSMVDSLADPLMHIIRNCLDHGIESVEARAANGKSKRGLIHIKASVNGGRVFIEIIDDGAGIDKTKVFLKAKSRGIVPPDRKIEEMEEQEVFNLIFTPGLSTAESVSDVSGRGVGMDVVRSNVERLGGMVTVESEVGRGTRLIISAPMSASITEGILVRVNHQPILIPLRSVLEIVDGRELGAMDIENRGQFLKFRNRMIPVVSLSQLFKSHYPGVIQSSYEEGNIIVIVEHGGHLLALEVSEVLGQSQVVQKSISGFPGNMCCIGGAAILGDGRVAVVIEVASLFSSQLVSQESLETGPKNFRIHLDSGVA